MTHREIFCKLAPDTRSALLAELQAQDKAAYKAAVEALAPSVNVRPVFIMRMPPAQRHAWLAKMLARKSSETITANILQLWLASCHRKMLVAFLDQLGIEHEEGMIESLPDEPPAGKLQPAVDHLLANFPRDFVMIYLRAFQAMDLAKWPELDAILDALDNSATPKSGPDEPVT